MRLKSTLSVVTLLGGLLLPFILFALSTDKQQDAYLEADSATINYKTGINNYQGHVKLIQGTTVILAEHIVTYSDAHHQLEKAIAIGQPASYSTLPDNDKLRFTASAQTINYYPSREQVKLLGAAQANHGHDQFAGPRLNYDIKQEIITSPASPQGHTTIIIQPNPKQR